MDEFPRARKPYRIGIIGDKLSLAPFLERVGSLGDLRSRGARLTALTGCGGEVPRLFALPVYPDWRAMLAAHPEITLVLETTGRPELLADLRRSLPAETVLAESGATEFFADLFASEGAACRQDLLHTQTLLVGIIDQLREEIVLADERGRVLDCNKAVLAARGLAKNAVVGRPLRRFFRLPEDLDPGIAPPLEKTLETGRAAEATLPETDGKGRLRYIREYVYPLCGPDGESTSILCIRRDITDRTRMEQRLQQAGRLASIGELSAYIAHEIRNPLFAIGGFANQLLRSANDPAEREKISIILEESTRLDGILKSILNFTRPAPSGHADVNRIVHGARELIDLACEGRGIRTEFALGEAPPPVPASPEVVRQCLLHLVKNSVEAMPGGGRLAVRTGLRRGRVVLEVEDSGSGIAPALREKAFSPFFTTKGGGSGLGLSIVKKFMDDLGGAVELASRTGAGTRVTLFLPPQQIVAKREANG